MNRFPLLMAVLTLPILGGSQMLTPPSTTTPAQRVPLEVTYIANEGFLVTAGNDKVLIDALHENPRGYSKTPEDVRKMMAGDQPPFDGVDLLVVSHPHPDHFDPLMVRSYLVQHPELVFVGSEATVGNLRDSAETAFGEIRGQIEEVTPPWGESHTLEFGSGSRARFLTLNHQTEDREPYLTLGSLVTLQGRTILHLADLFPSTSEGYLDGYGLEEEEIDVLFADPYFVTSDVGKRLIREVIQPKHLILMHLRPQVWEEHEAKVLEFWPQAIVFWEPLDGKVF